MKKILLTGIAGFIGYSTADALLERGDDVIGIDSFNDYYDTSLKRARVKRLKPSCRIYEVDICDLDKLRKIFFDHKFDAICHLAAQAGVGYSLKNPFVYETTNNLGTLNLLELTKEYKIPAFIYASSSSVYGANTKYPFSESDAVNSPMAIYAATKRYNELLASAYSHLYGFHTTGLRFFTAYGPWGRPDMALFKFTKAILADSPIDLYNHGKMKRDFTFVTDIVAGVLSAIDKNYPCEIFNLGNSQPVDLGYFVNVLEKELGKAARKNMLGMQPGDVPESFADISKSFKMLGYKPKVKVEEGIHRFVSWYLDYYGHKNSNLGPASIS